MFKKTNKDDETAKRINEDIEWYKANGTTKEEAEKEFEKYRQLIKKEEEEKKDKNVPK